MEISNISEGSATLSFDEIMEGIFSFYKDKRIGYATLRLIRRLLNDYDQNVS